MDLSLKEKEKKKKSRVIATIRKMPQYTERWLLYCIGQETVFSSSETSCYYRIFPALCWDETKNFQSLCETPRSHTLSKNNHVQVPASPAPSKGPRNGRSGSLVRLAVSFQPALPPEKLLKLIHIPADSLLTSQHVLTNTRLSRKFRKRAVSDTMRRQVYCLLQRV